ncbi:MAG: hypothetical protein II943_05755 [Victivallales bacterium]|nr:hypothetical protein [Victivallales bacterium]
MQSPEVRHPQDACHADEAQDARLLPRAGQLPRTHLMAPGRQAGGTECHRKKDRKARKWTEGVCRQAKKHYNKMGFRVSG